MNNIDIEKKEYYNQIFDYYRNMLTEKQSEYFELYFQNDYTLEEIAEQFKISRAAIHDSVTKTIANLENLELKLGMYKKISNIKKILDLFMQGVIKNDEIVEKIEQEL